MSQAIELINQYKITKDEHLLNDIFALTEKELINNRNQLTFSIANNAALGIEFLEKFYNKLFTDSIAIDSELANQYNNKLKELNLMHTDINLTLKYLVEVDRV